MTAARSLYFNFNRGASRATWHIIQLIYKHGYADCQ